MKNMKVPKQVSLRTFLIALATSILAVSCLFYVFAQTPTETFYISGGIYPGGFSYTFFRDGSNYFAKNENGYISYSGSNSSDVWDNAQDSLTSGGSIFVARGAYAVTNPWLIGSDITVIFEKGAVLTLANSADCNVIQNENANSGDTNIRVSGGQIDGNKAGQSNVASMWSYGVRLNNCSDCIVEYMLIEDCFVAGIYLSDTSNTTVQYNTVYDCGYTSSPWYTNQAGDGIVAYAAGGGEVDARNVIRGNRVYGSWRTNILVNGYGSGYWMPHTLIEGNVVSGSSVGIYVDYAPFTDVVNNIVIDNSQYDILCYGSVRSEIIIIGDSNYSRVIDNTVRYSNSHGIYVYGGIGIVVSGNSVENCTQTGIGIDLTEYCTISSNVIGNNGLNGITWYRSLNGSISGNIIFDNGWDSATADGLSVTGSASINSSHVIMTSNRIYNSPRYGIYEAGTYTDNNIVFLNDAVGNDHASYDIYTLGSGTIKDHNLGRTN